MSCFFFATGLATGLVLGLEAGFEATWVEGFAAVEAGLLGVSGVMVAAVAFLFVSF